MIPRVIEYNCQYTDQIRKKHKAWHDGKLKYFHVNSRFILYSIDDGKLLCSAFITNVRELENILDPVGFNLEEHRIFGRFIIVISDKICEYDGEVMSQANTNIERQSPKTRNPQSETKMRENRQVVKNIINSNSNSGNSLALKMNRPFKPPRRICNQSKPIVSTLNRPNIRKRDDFKHEAHPAVKIRTTNRQRIRQVCHQPIVL